MAYTVPLVYNATEELVDADNYPELRLFTVAKIGSASVRNFCWLPPLLLTPRGTQFQANLLGIDQPWTVASSTSLNSTGTGFFYFSAVCWFAAKDMISDADEAAAKRKAEAGKKPAGGEGKRVTGGSGGPSSSPAPSGGKPRGQGALQRTKAD